MMTDRVDQAAGSADQGQAAGSAGPSQMELDTETRERAPKRSAETPGEDINAVLVEIDQLTAGLFDSLKAEQFDEVKSAMEAQFRRHQEDVDEEDLNKVTQLALEIGAVDFAELYSPERFQERAQDFGLRPGFAIDLQTGWDMRDKEQVDQVDYLIDEEDPMFLIGSPPCTVFSKIRKLSNFKRDPQNVAEEECEGRHHSKVACRFYKKQAQKGRSFLHEHPDGASSWNDEEVKKVEALNGTRDAQGNEIRIYVVKGPMCNWNLKATERQTKRVGLAQKETKWMTNDKVLADLLEGICANKQKDARKWHRHVQLVGGLARGAQCYTPELVGAILSTIKSRLKDDSELNELEMKTSGPSPHEPDWFNDWQVEEEYEDFFDTVNGGFLEPVLVKKARAEELTWVRGEKIFDEEMVSWETAKQRMKGVPPISVKWVDTNKGDDGMPNYRSRLVAREIKKLKKLDQQLEVKDLFSAMPPLEALKILISLLMSTEECDEGAWDGKTGEFDEELHLALFDISRAHFYGISERELYVLLPKELNPEGKFGGRACSKLLRTMYGTQDASRIWQDTYKAPLEEKKYQRGTSNAAVFKGPNREKALVHGDDFLILATQKSIDEFEEVLLKKFKLRKEWQIGFGPKDSKSGRVLNRIITLEDRPRRAIIEPDARHAQLIVKELNLEKAKEVETPAEKLSAEKQMADASLPPGGMHEQKMYRSVVM